MLRRVKQHTDVALIAIGERREKAARMLLAQPAS